MIIKNICAYVENERTNDERHITNARLVNLHGRRSVHAVVYFKFEFFSIFLFHNWNAFLRLKML